MKKLFFVISPLLIFPIFLTFLTPSVFAAKHISKEEIVLLPKDEVISEDYFAMGEKVNLAGKVEGDAYLFGGNIFVEGEIDGDLIAAGGTITIRGKITKDARIAGGQIIVSGEIGGNLTTAGGSVEITDSAKIDGSLVLGAGNISVFGPIGKGMTFGAGSINLGNSVGTNVTGSAGQLTLTPNTNIAGDLNYWSDTPALIQQGATVNGKITHNMPPQRVEPETNFWAIFTGVSLALKIVNFLAAFFIGILLLKFFPGFTQRTANNLAQKLLPSLGLGILAIILVPITFAILLLTIVGIPIGLAVLMAFIAKLYLAKIFAALLIGQKVLSYFGQKSKNLAIFVGLIIYIILSSTPIIGWLLAILVALSGLGAILIEDRNTYKQIKSKL